MQLEVMDKSETFCGFGLQWKIRKQSCLWMRGDGGIKTPAMIQPEGDLGIKIPQRAQ
jgi:hypothetical protein